MIFLIFLILEFFEIIFLIFLVLMIPYKGTKVTTKSYLKPKMAQNGPKKHNKVFLPEGQKKPRPRAKALRMS